LPVSQQKILTSIEAIQTQNISSFSTRLYLQFRWCAGNAAKVDFGLTNYSTKSEMLDAIDRIAYLGENTNMTGGLRVARLQVFDVASARQSVANGVAVQRILMLITDGVPTYDADKLNDEVVAVKADNIRVIAVGITDKVRFFRHYIFYKQFQKYRRY
jgi:hypothetical protein